MPISLFVIFTDLLTRHIVEIRNAHVFLNVYGQIDRAESSAAMDYFFRSQCTFYSSPRTFLFRLLMVTAARFLILDQLQCA